MELASTLPLVVGQCVEMIENMVVDHEHMVVIVSYVVNVRIVGDIMMLIALVATCGCPIN
jgi:hypothetical protein